MEENERKSSSIKGIEIASMIGKKTFPLTLKNLMLEQGLIKQVKKTPQEFEALKVDSDVQFNVIKRQKNQRARKHQGRQRLNRASLSTPLKADLTTQNLSKPTPTAPGPSFSAIMEQVGKYCQPYFERLDTMITEFAIVKQCIVEIANKIGIENFPIQSQELKIKSIQLPKNQLETLDDQEIFNQLTQICKKIDEKAIYGGEIPIPDAWQGLEQLDLNLTRENFQAALLRFEDDRKIDLHITNDPSLVHFPEKGINDPNRGLIYYIAIRK